MLLTRITTAFRRLRTEERGAGMAAVIGLLAVSLLTTSLVAASVVQATRYTTASRANVQSQAAAEAGIAVARAGLIAGNCATNSNRYASATGAVPAYVATVWIPSGSSWVRGCPTGTATQVRILSTGYAQNNGVTGANAGDRTNIEVILSASATPSTITASGPAVYAYNSQGFGGGGRLLTIGGTETSIMIREGDVTCDGGAAGQADIVVNNGSLTVASGCGITGDAFASGRVTMPGGPNIGGSVVANALTISGGSKVGGHVWVNQDVTLDGGVAIGGNVTAASMSFKSGGTVGGNAQVSGAVTWTGGGPEIKGNLTAGSFSASSSGDLRGNVWIYGAMSVNWTTKSYKATTVRSLSGPNGPAPTADWYRYNKRDFFPNQDPTIVAGGPGTSPYATNAARPAWPVVPEWINFDYVPADWSGFAVATISSTSTCTYAQVNAAVQSFAGQNGIVNAMGCQNGIYIGSDNKVALASNVAIFAKAYTLTEGGGFTASQARKLWLITPDQTVETPTRPSCVTGENSFTVTGGFTFSSTLNVMMYTPCKVALASGTTFTGQVFAGKASINGGATLTYTAIGLPGYNLDTGVRSVSTSTESDRTIVSYRDVQVGN